VALAQQECEEDELELLELALAQSKDAIDNLEEVMLQYVGSSNYCGFNQQDYPGQVNNIFVA
jgi:hypothetical protein